jgi:hypothetical protein
MAVFSTTFSQIYREVHATAVKVDLAKPTTVDVKRMKKAGLLPDSAQSAPRPLYLVRFFLDGLPPSTAATWRVAIGNTKHCYAHFKRGIFFTVFTNDIFTDLSGKPLKLVSSNNEVIDLNASFPLLTDIADPDSTSLDTLPDSRTLLRRD